MSRLLVCPPDYFRINYEINPWMRCENAVDSARAMSQWHALMNVLSHDVGAGIEQMPALKGLPDMVFTANAGVVVGRRALVSRFRHPERQREEVHFERWFREQGYEVLTMEKALYFEGAGDLLGFPDTWFGGYRQRSDIRAFPIVGDMFQREIIPLELIDARFYHLDTCFCPLTGGELLYFPSAFDAYGQAAIAQWIPEARRLTVPEDEALRFACNAVCIGKHIIIPAGCPRTTQLLEARGYRTYTVELDEFMKSGGAAKCLTLALD
jgi:N-dimethylarginine dimethylaminohydrolase